MAIKTVLFMIGFIVCSGGALFAPVLGVLGYVGHYNLGPERQWWIAPIRGLGLRYSFTLAVMTAVGMLLNLRKLRFGKSVLNRHEILILTYLGWVWILYAISEPTVGARYALVDHPAVKLTKVIIFVLMMSHIVTDFRKLNWLLWALVLGALVLGMQAYDTPRSSFMQGRLETVGGPDFRDSNRLGGYLAATLFIIGAQFVRSGWFARAVCFLAGGFAANAVVLTRSRGALMGAAGGCVVSMLLAPKRHRLKIFIGLTLAFAGGLYLSDPQFRARMSTITRPPEQRDRSAQNRIEIWRGGVKMLMSNPLGVGPGNFHQSIGKYTGGRFNGSDAHSTYVRCACDLGFPGLALLGMLILNAARSLRRSMKQAHELPGELQNRVLWMSYGAAASLGALLTYGLTATLIYFEAFWWVLALPICISRATENALADASPAPEPAPGRLSATAGGL